MTNQLLTDHQGRQIRLTEERWQHILTHPEMDGQQNRLQEVLSSPEVVIATQKDASVHAYHRWYERTPVTQKHAVVVVKLLENDAFVLTAYFTSRVRKGNVIWQR